MIAALMILVCAVVVVGWLMAAVAFVAISVSMIPRVLDPTSPEDSVGAQVGSLAADAQFLRDVGIRP